MAKRPRDETLFLARLAEQAERFDEMAEYATELAKTEELNNEERNILSVAYKNVVGSKRSAWRVLNSIDRKEEKKGNTSNSEKAKKFKKNIEGEISKMCNEVLKLIDDFCIGKCSNDESKVFYLKMKGDYYRYLAEFQSTENKKIPSEKALDSYKVAFEIAEANLPSTHPTRLGLVLNYSVFYYEILKQPEKAIEMAKKTFDEAIKDLDNVTDESYKDATLIMQLIRDNLTLWNTALGKEGQ